MNILLMRERSLQCGSPWSTFYSQLEANQPGIAIEGAGLMSLSFCPGSSQPFKSMFLKERSQL